MCLSYLPGEREGSDSVHYHFEGVSLGHSLIGVEVVDWLSCAPYHQCGPLVIAVECELHANGLIKSDGPQHFHLILLIECVRRVNTDKTPVLLLCMMLPQKSHFMHTLFDAPLHPGTSCSVPQSSFTSDPASASTHFSIILCRIYPTLTVWPPGCFSNHISFPSMSAQYAAHVGWHFTSHLVNNTSISHRTLLASPKHIHQCWRLTKYVPLGRTPPDIIIPTVVTVSVVRSRRTCSRGGPP